MTSQDLTRRKNTQMSREWKGLDTAEMPVFLGYDQTERMIAALLDRAAQWQPDAVVGIARGGLVPATMAAGILALPLAMIGFDRASGATVDWRAPPAASAILLVDDGCSTGRRCGRCATALLQEGRDCLTLAVVHDPEVTGYVPDLSHADARAVAVPLGTRRGDAGRTCAARDRRRTGSGDRIAVLRSGPRRRVPARRAGRGVPAPTSPRRCCSGTGWSRSPPCPSSPPERAVVITGRPDEDRERTQAWLARWGHGALPLECRPPHVPHTPDAVARYKAETATRWGCTHFVESDAEQALRIAAHAPHLVVSWWSAADARAWLIGAAARPL